MSHDIVQNIDDPDENDCRRCTLLLFICHVKFVQ
jgi:hypothetical protein